MNFSASEKKLDVSFLSVIPISMTGWGDVSAIVRFISEAVLTDFDEIRCGREIHWPFYAPIL
jgi:hypothetical protein